MRETIPLPVFDGHNDTLLNLYLPERGGGRSFYTKSRKYHIDWPRARQGGLAGGFFAIFVPQQIDTRSPDPASPDRLKQEKSLALDHKTALTHTQNMIDLLFQIEEQGQGRVNVVRDINELTDCMNRGILAMILHLEGAEAVHPSLDNLPALYKTGVRSIGLVWSRPNAFGHGVPFVFPGTPDTGPGLTEAGSRLVLECNRLGILLDLSHLNKKGFWDVAGLSKRPLVASHSCVHALCPSSRNLTDGQLTAIKNSNGIVGLNFGVPFLRSDGQTNADTPLEVLVDHFDYVIDRIGVEHVGFGSDFDGVLIPEEMGDVTGLPKLIRLMKKRGYDDESLTKISHLNWIRVIRQSWI